MPTLTTVKSDQAYQCVVLAEHSHSRSHPTMFILFEHQDSDAHTTTPTTPLKFSISLSALVCRLYRFLAFLSLRCFYIMVHWENARSAIYNTAVWNLYMVDYRLGLVGLVVEAFTVCTQYSSTRYLTIWHRSAASARVFGDVLSRPFSIPCQNERDVHPRQILQTACDKACCQMSMPQRLYCSMSAISSGGMGHLSGAS